MKETGRSKGLSEGSESEARNSTAAENSAPSGRLLGVTATGPVYWGERHYIIVSPASAFALLQELALRVDQQEAAVTSSLAKRVSGRDAYHAWLSLSVEMSVQLGLLSPSARVSFVRLALGFARRVGRIDGLETVLTSSVNAAWPWLSLDVTDRVLTLVTAKIRKSEFAQRHMVALVDVTQRTVGILPADGLARLDIDEWRASRAFFVDALLPSQLGSGAASGLSNLFQSPLERAIDQLFGGDTPSPGIVGGLGGSQSLDDIAASLLGGRKQGGVPGGPLGATDLPGAKNSSKKDANQSLDDIAASLLGGRKQGGVPGGPLSAADLPGAKDSSKKDASSLGAAEDLLGSVPGSEYKGVSGFLRKSGPSGFRTGIFEGATPGGPFAPPGQLGVNGSGEQGWTDAVRDTAAGLGIAGAAALAIVSLPATAPVAVVVGGAAALGAASGFLVGLGVSEGYEAYKQDHPEPPKEKPRKGDLYPDPDGGGSGDPTQLPAYEGQGGGHPARLPDSNGTGGGTPNTIFGRPQEGASIWDKDFGKPGPTIKPQAFAVASLVGPGLMVDLVQVGPAVVRF